MSLLANESDLAVPTTFSRGDHVELAEALIARLREHGPVVFADGKLYRYAEASHLWQPVPDHEQSRTVQSFAGALVGGGEKVKRLKISRTDVQGATKNAWDLIADPGFFKDAPPGLTFANGFVQVDSTGIHVHQHDPRHRARFGYDFDYAAIATPRWLQFLVDTFAHDEDPDDGAQKALLLQEYVGVSLLGQATKFQKCLLLHGEGANGKGVFLKVAKAAAPTGSCVAIPPQTWGSEYRVAMLAGKLLNIVNELPEADILESEIFKAVVAGDDTTGRHIYDSPFTFAPVAGQIFAANRLPQTDDQTHGFWRRILIVGFDRIILDSEANIELANELIAAELPGIVAWFLAGAHRALVQRRFTIPASSGHAVAAWSRDANAVHAFVDERLERLGSDEPAEQGVQASVLYNWYKAWTTENGHRPMASNKFGARMKRLGMGSIEKSDANYYPVRLRKLRSMWGTPPGVQIDLARREQLENEKKGRR